MIRPFQRSTNGAASENEEAEEEGTDMGQYAPADILDKADPEHWRQRRLQQRASLSLVPAARTATPSLAIVLSDCSISGIREEEVDEAWVRRAGRLSEEQPLEEVTELDLQAVDAPALSGLDCLGLLLPSLEGLSFSLRSRLPSLRDLGTPIGRTLRSLDVTACGLEGVEGIAALPLLRELHASHNRIRDVGPLCLHEHLEVLDLAANPLRRLAALDILTSVPKLHTLTLRGTPLRNAIVRAGEQGEEAASSPSPPPASSFSSGVGEGEACYRALVGAVLPRLLLLDGRKLLLPPAGGTMAKQRPPPVQAWLIERTHVALHDEEKEADAKEAECRSEERRREDKLER